MQDLWACIEPQGAEARLLVTDAGKRPLLKARLTPRPQHRRALPMLLEALAQWQGQPIRAALVADAQGRSDLSIYHDCLVDACETPLYSIAIVPPLAVLRRMYRDEIGGMGRFHDLQEVLRFEVAQ